MRPPKPQARDVVGIIEFVQTYGSVDYPINGVPADFTAWRAGLRTEAKRIGMRISVRRFDDIAFVFDPDHRPSEAQLRATVEAVAALTPRPDALARATRSKAPARHLRLVRKP